jgi:flagellar biosynthesis component FlhA
MTKESQNLKKKIEMSKLILYALFLLIIVMIVVSMVLAFLGMATSYEIAMTGVFSLATIAVGFYYWKAKAENMHKYKQDDKITMIGDTDENK